ncbi:MAG: choline/ethanolamine kinase family protein [Gammaproteobacteria bacterium]|nr:choline/ethanolamine kinase family protein [Gammaproteobacteria bacterium]
MNPTAALARLPGLETAHVLEMLADTPVSRSFRIRDGERDLALKIDKPLAARLRLDRVRESEVLELACKHGIGPAAVAADAPAGLLVTEFLSGRTPAAGDLQRPEFLERVAKLLGILHTLPPVGRSIDPAAAARAYASAIGTTDARQLADRIVGLLDDNELAHATPCLCHNDIHPENLRVMTDGRLMLLDWEYAGVGHRGFEFAVILRHNKLSGAARDALLDAYEHFGGHLRRLDMPAWYRVYDGLAVLWELATHRVAG